MKILSLVFDKSGLNLLDKDAELTLQELAYNIISQFVMAYATENKGLNEEERRKFYKLCDVLEDGVKNNSDSVNLEDDWASFLQKCRSKAKFMPNKLTQRIEELIDDMKDVTNG